MAHRVVRERRRHDRVPLGSSPNTTWGSSAADAPPSFDVGPNPPRTGRFSALGKCADVNQSATPNGTKIQLWDCNGTGAQTWQLITNP